MAQFFGEGWRYDHIHGAYYNTTNVTSTQASYGSIGTPVQSAPGNSNPSPFPHNGISIPPIPSTSGPPNSGNNNGNGGGTSGSKGSGEDNSGGQQTAGGNNEDDPSNGAGSDVA